MATREQTRAYYDKYAGRYDQRTGFAPNTGQAYNFERYYQPFFDRSVPRAGSVLEIGCGTGFYTRWLSERGLRVVAMDASPKMVEEAKLRCPQGVELVVGDCQDPAAALGRERVGEGFDAIVGVNTFSYYPDKKRALRNFRGLLREQGRLVLLDIHGNAYSQRIAYLTNFRQARQFAENIGQSTRANLASLLPECGFRVESIERFTFMPNAVRGVGVAILLPIDRILSRIPLADSFAIRIAVVATRA